MQQRWEWEKQKLLKLNQNKNITKIKKEHVQDLKIWIL